MDRLGAMRTFVEIVERGSLSAAAEALERSQPTIVRTLAALEQHLDVTLLRRTTRRMSLTPEGHDYLERCRRILADVDEAERVVRQDTSEPRGALRMTGPLEFGRMHLAPALAGFLWRYDQISVDLLLLDRNVDLVDEGIDLALRIGELADSSMIAVRLGAVRLVTVASPALIERTGIPKHPNELSGLPCVRIQNIPRAASSWQFSDDKKLFRVPTSGSFSVNQVAAAASACVNGTGFGQFLSYQVDELVSEGRLRPVLEDFEVRPWPVSLVYPGGRPATSRLRALIDWLKTELPQRAAIA
jgi:DNA-binding transcriptional LysR family regulator